MPYAPAVISEQKERIADLDAKEKRNISVV